MPVVKRDIVVIGASAGGVEAVPRLLSSLKRDIKAAFFVSLHVSPNKESVMPRLISREGQLRAEHARNGTQMRYGRVYVAPPDYHLIVGTDMIRLSHGPKENRHRPAIDPMFRTAARAYGDRVAGVLLTGNLDDGTAGLRMIQKHGGLTIVQDPEEAPYPEMPRNAMETVGPDHVLKLREIEDLLARLPNASAGGRKVNARKSVKDSSQSPEYNGVIPEGGEPMPFVCPECHGPLWEVRDGKVVRYQCLVGHRYTLESLAVGHAEELETALWIALRTLEERVMLQRRLADQCRAAGRKSSERMFHARIVENEKHAAVLRGILEKGGGKKG